MLIQYITWKEVRTHKKILTRSFLLEQQYMTKILSPQHEAVLSDGVGKGLFLTGRDQSLRRGSRLP